MEFTKDDGKTYIVENLKINEDFTNRFAQQVYKLEDGSTIYIDYDREALTLERPKELAK